MGLQLRLEVRCIRRVERPLRATGHLEDATQVVLVFAALSAQPGVRLFDRYQYFLISG